MSGEIGGIARDQLERWEKVARKWTLNPRILLTEEGHRAGAGVEQVHFTCGGFRHFELEPEPLGGCGQSVYVLHDGSSYLPSAVDYLLAHTVAHLRNVHRDLEDKVYAEMGSVS